MKFLAILYDSFREAVDGWVIYVTLGASTLFIVLIACIGYEPVSAEKAFESITRRFQIVYANRNRSTMQRQFLFGLHFQAAEVKALTAAKRPQEADYQVRLVIEERDGNGPFLPFGPVPVQPQRAQEDESKDKKSVLRDVVSFWASSGERDDTGLKPDEVDERLTLDFVRDLFEFHGNVKVTKVERLASNHDRHEFLVTTQGEKGVRGWLHEPTFLFGALTVPIELSLGMLVYIIQDRIINGVGAWVALLVGVLLTASFIPNMMRKGAIDLIIAKPIRRVSLLVYKYVGGLTFVFINTAYAVTGVWLVTGLRSGVWSNGFLLTIFAITFYFAILYAVSLLLGVLSRNTIVAIMGTIAFWFALWLAGSIYEAVDVFRREPSTRDRIPSWVYRAVDTVNTVLPRTKDLDKLTSKLVVQDTLGEGDKRQLKLDTLTWPSWSEVLSVSGIYICVMLGLAAWRFSTRDY
jgi:ABC-type transport system involved in multi-copper enzyme maturation permease subunit